MMRNVLAAILILMPFLLYAQNEGEGVSADPPAAAQNSESSVDENVLFSDQNTVIDSSEYEKEDVDASQNEKHLGVSGELTTVSSYTVTRNSLADGNLKGNTLSPYIDGILFLDARLPTGVKGFGSYEILYQASDAQSKFYVREMFVDFNINQRIYFRSGKQVLQWGRCYLWNPTDMINVEKKSFETKIGEREGTYGLKAHIPFGTTANIYGFLDTYKVDDIDQIAQAVKFEYLFQTTEMAFSIWNRRDCRPVFGYDLSTRLGKFDILGETSLSYGSNTQKARVTTISTPVGNRKMLSTYRESDTLIAKASLNAGRAFDIGDEKDKLQINGELFFNGDGYSNNYFEGSKAGDFVVDPVAFFMANNLYQANYYSRYYAALFTTINKFFHPDLTQTVNLIGNLEQQSFILSGTLSYADMHGFTASASCSLYLGGEDTEYTFLNNAFSCVLSAGFTF